MGVKFPVWTLETALAVVRKLQPLTRLYGYHLCMGGGVLNRGESNKDLDLYLLPLDDQGTVDYDGMLMEMETEFGPSADISVDPEYLAGMESPCHAKRKFANDGKRVDAFFIKGGVAV